MKILPIILLSVLGHISAVMAQRAPVDLDSNGYIIITDQAVFDSMKNKAKNLYLENIQYYNNGVEYYNKEDFESAYFYFAKAFDFGIFNSFYIKYGVGLKDEIIQNKALYALLSVLKTSDPRKEDIRDARELVSDKCDPERTRIADTAWIEYKEGKKRRKS